MELGLDFETSNQCSFAFSKVTDCNDSTEKSQKSFPKRPAPPKLFPLLSLPICQFPDCESVAVGGTCDFKFCFARGCGRLICRQHKSYYDANEYADLNSNRVCCECEKEASKQRTRIIALVFLICLTFLTVLLILFCGGSQVASLFFAIFLVFLTSTEIISRQMN